MSEEISKKIDPAAWIEENMGMIKSITRQFYINTTKFSAEDLEQECYVAVIKAAENYNPLDNRSKFSTYVFTAIRRTVRDFIRKNKNDLYVTIYQQEKDWEASVALEKKEAEAAANGLGPLDLAPEPKKRSVCSPMAIRADKEKNNGLYEGQSFWGAIPSGDPGALDGMIKSEEVAILREEIEQLPENERSVINQHWLNGVRIVDIAKAEGVSRSRIYQISERAINRLKSSMGDRLELLT